MTSCFFIMSITSFLKEKALISFLIWFMNSTSIPNQFVYFTPHITTLIVLSFANQRIKLPEKIGVPYKKGEIN